MEASSHRSAPNWEELYAVAQAQNGYFTTGQAATAGYSPQLLQARRRGLLSEQEGAELNAALDRLAESA